jgi:5-methylthioribose kinase
MGIMREIDADSAADYLRATGRVPHGVGIRVRALTGGVSNVVLRVDAYGMPPFVLKQARERLRVAMDWRAPLERIWAERAALDVLGDILPEGTVPRVLFEDRPNYLFAMTCAPDDAVTWKSRLMDGWTDRQTDIQHATTAGKLLAQVHARSVGHPVLASILADTSLFDALRIDPYYRTVCRVQPDLKLAIETLIATMPAAEPEPVLVLGDYSPKNILVHSGGMVLLDFECAHAGDPAFDVGFCLSHLILKVFRARGALDYITLVDDFLLAYRELSNEAFGEERTARRMRRAVRHAGACLYARLDGKSPVEYRDELDQDAVRDVARLVLTDPDFWAADPSFVAWIAATSQW